MWRVGWSIPPPSCDAEDDVHVRHHASRADLLGDDGPDHQEQEDLHIHEGHLLHDVLELPEAPVHLHTQWADTDIYSPTIAEPQNLQTLASKRHEIYILSC